MESPQTIIFLPELDLAEAEQGDKDAQYRVGLYNRQQKNYTEAVKWLQQAGNQDHLDALTTLAMLYETGEGVAQNTTEALKLYRKAAEQGHAEAKNKMMELYQSIKSSSSANNKLPSPPATSQPQETIHVNATDAWFNAARDGDLSRMQSLLNQGLVSVSTYNPNWKGQRAINVAAINGHVAIMQFLIEIHRSQEGDKYVRFLPMGESVMYNQLAVVKLLLSHGYDVNQVFEAGERSIITHARTPEMLELLISAKADLTYKDRRGNGPLEYAIINNTLDLYAILLQKGLKPTHQTLYKAIENNQIELVKELSKTFDLTMKDKENRTILHNLANSSTVSADMINFIIDAGVDVNARTKATRLMHIDYGGETALYFVAKNLKDGFPCNEGFLKALLVRGANYKIKCAHLHETAFSAMRLSQEQFEERYADCITYEPSSSKHKPGSSKQGCLTM